jgi:hypothetical protein
LRESAEAAARASMVQTLLEIFLTMMEDRGDEMLVVCADLDMAASLVENYSLMQYSVIDRQRMGAESRELAAGYGQELRSRSRLGWDGNTMEGQDIAEDVTFHDSDRGHD